MKPLVILQLQSRHHVLQNCKSMFILYIKSFVTYYLEDSSENFVNVSLLSSRKFNYQTFSFVLHAQWPRFFSFCNFVQFTSFKLRIIYKRFLIRSYVNLGLVIANKWAVEYLLKLWQKQLRSSISPKKLL